LNGKINKKNAFCLIVFIPEAIDGMLAIKTLYKLDICCIIVA